MRTQEEYRKILELWQGGMPKQRIGLKLGIPRATVRDCINRYECVEKFEHLLTEQENRFVVSSIMKELQLEVTSENQLLHKTYSYMLGMYLGDGCISATRRNVYRMRITLDVDYPAIIDECMKSLRVLFPTNEVGIEYKNYQ